MRPTLGIVVGVVTLSACGTSVPGTYGTPDAGDLPDAASDASSFSDAGEAGTTEGGSSCASPQTWYIDADGDGYGAAAVQLCATPTSGYASKNGDCDDTDARAYPGQPAYFDTPRKSGGFDFDCNGDEQEESTLTGACHPDGNMANPQCIGAGNMNVWYSETVAPACGETAGWLISCTARPAIGCGIISETRTQKCK